MRKVVFRVDGYKEIGTGHIYRCLALADMLKNDFEISFAIQAREPKILNLVQSYNFKTTALPITENISEDVSHFLEGVSREDIVVLDGYKFDETYQEKVQLNCRNLVFIDDENKFHFDCDVVINHANYFQPEDYKKSAKKEDKTQFYTGSQYALLRKEFIAEAQKEPHFRTPIKSVLICLGGADPENYSGLVIEALEGFKIGCVIGISNPNTAILNMKYPHVEFYPTQETQGFISLIQSYDSFFCTASTLCQEAFAIAIPTVICTIADNQITVEEGLKKTSTVFSVGDIRKKNLLQIKESLKSFLNTQTVNPDATFLLAKMVTQQRNLVDGQSGIRLLEIFKKLAGR